MNIYSTQLSRRVYLLLLSNFYSLLKIIIPDIIYEYVFPANPMKIF